MNYLEKDLLLHPLLQPCDAAKFCFQAVFGAEHLLADPSAARAWFFAEFEATPPVLRPLTQPLSDCYCRVDLAAWKANELSPEALFSLFLKTAQTPSKASLTDLEAMLHTVGQLARGNRFAFSEKSWDDFSAQYPRKPVHHSEIYRNAYHPSYRVVNRALLSADFF